MILEAVDCVVVESSLAAGALGTLFYLTIMMVITGFTIGNQIIMARRFGEAFETLAADARGAVSAQVTTAVPLTAAQSKGVTAALRTALGKDPEIETRVDPALLGGIKVQVGSRLFDASLRSKLDSLKFALKRA